MTQMLSPRSWSCTVIAAFALSGCGRDLCPSANSPKGGVEWQADMRARRLLEVDPEHLITIKRDQHYFDVSVSAERFVSAFHLVMIDPQRRFGLIRIDRDPDLRTRPFQLGERFQGRYELAKGQSDSGLVCRIENGATSDYGQISQLKLEPNAEHHYLMQYRYLSGSPMAGSSTFEVRGITEATSRVTQTFVYQENDVIVANLFSLGVLKLHDQVVYSQVAQSAAQAGGRITGTDLLGSYRTQ